MSELKRVLIMAGGTGGHVFPGLALAAYLREKGVDVHWLGTNQGLEAQLVPEAQLPLHVVSIKGLRGKGLKALLSAPFKILSAITQSSRIIRQIHPDVVIGMGGYASGPGGIASWLNGCPLVIHEQNAKAGYTNRLLGKIAKKILTGFPSAFEAGPRVVSVGNPVRLEIETLPTPEARLLPTRAPFRLLVLGGSLGAQALNDLVPQALALVNAEERPQVLHQTGSKHVEATKKLYESMGVEADVQPFIKDMAGVYSWADMVLCRAGALTVAELCAAGLGAVFVPFPFAVDDHQTANATFMVKHQAALCVQQAELTANQLADIVSQLAKAPEQRLAMAKAAYELRKVRVVEKMYDVCKEVCR